MIVQVTRAKKISKIYGRVSKLEFPDGSRVYISKKGWNLVTPKKSKIQLAKILKRVNKTGTLEIRITFWRDTGLY